MSKPVIITADSTVDLSSELLKRYQIHTIPLTVTLGDESFPDDESFTPFVMYERYHMDGTLPKTSAPSFHAFMDFFSGFTEQGFEVVHLDISAELSSTYNVAQMAAAELGGVYVVDSRMLSTGIGLLAVEAAECRERGMCAADIAEHLNALKEKVSQLCARHAGIHVERRTLHRSCGIRRESSEDQTGTGDEKRKAGNLQKVPWQHRKSISPVYHGASGGKADPARSHFSHRIRRDSAECYRRAGTAGKESVWL